MSKVKVLDKTFETFIKEEDLLEKMNEFGCLTEYEVELEARYRRKNK